MSRRRRRDAPVVERTVRRETCLALHVQGGQLLTCGRPAGHTRANDPDRRRHFDVRARQYWD